MSRHQANSPQAVTDHQIAVLNTQLRGDAIHWRHPEFEKARQVWNQMIDRRPGVIVRCKSDEDVAASIAFSREHGIALTVRGGGHSVAGHSVIDDGIVIDLSPMRQVTVDPDSGRVHTGGGALLADLDQATQAFGLATPAGTMSQTGIGGLSLGGGIGWLTRKHGLTCDNLVSARTVLADGSIVTSSATENPDLYWGLRGAGTNFGVVTHFEFTAHPVGTTLPVGVALYRLDQAAAALAHYEKTMRRAADDLKVTAYLRLAPAEPGVPDDMVNEPACMLVSVWTGDPAEAEDVNRDLWSGASYVYGAVNAIPYLELQSMYDSLLGAGACNYTKGAYLAELGSGCIETLIASARRLRSPVSVIEFSYQHGAQDRLREDETAFPDRHADHFINVVSRWECGDDHRPLIQWARDVFDATAPWHSGGLYTNFMAFDDDLRVKEAYRGGKYERLAVIKSKYYPDNVFNKNPNIAPARNA
jgi:hypothetical protein